MKIRKPIKKRSAKMAKLMREYRKQKAVFLIDEPYCWGCDNATLSQDIHHQRGRGEYLMDKTTWMPVCRECHRYIHDHPKWSYEQGWMIKRIL